MNWSAACSGEPVFFSGLGEPGLFSLPSGGMLQSTDQRPYRIVCLRSANEPDTILDTTIMGR